MTPATFKILATRPRPTHDLVNSYQRSLSQKKVGLDFHRDPCDEQVIKHPGGIAGVVVSDLLPGAVRPDGSVGTAAVWATDRKGKSVACLVNRAYNKLTRPYLVAHPRSLNVRMQ